MSRVLVVGGTKGIGKVIAQTLTARGDAVAVVGRNTPGEEWIPWAKLTHLILCQRFRGKIDAWRGEIETSLTLTRDLIEGWADNFDGENNSIVIMSSIIAHTVADEQPVSYHMAKAALEGMIRYYAVELGPRGIRVNGIAPGVVLKDSNKEYYKEHPEKVNLFNRTIPLGRMGTAEDIAGVAQFLCSPAASFITGQTIVVDGGVSLLNQESLVRRMAEGAGA
jgi:hypothetical protein